MSTTPEDQEQAMSTCASCGAAGQPAGARFCFACGAAMTVPACAACGEPLVPGARFCSGCGAEQSEAPTERQVASRRVTSVLFADLVGFTPLAESRDQEQVRELLSRYFEACRAVVARYGGTVEKFAGDAVMAVWGVPAAHEDDAERAVRAGLELVSAVGSVGGDVGAELAVRVGIVTGEVAVVVGAQHQGMVAGDAVNTAARVQSVAEPGQVWVDETTRLLSSSAIAYVDVGSHQLKGKADPTPLWAVRAVVAAVGGALRADGLEAPLVGREREIRLVKELFHRVEETGRPALLIVDGDPGVGKSRLGWEFEKYVDGLSDDVAWHSGRCLSYGEGVAFYGLAEAVRTRLQVLADRREDEREDEEDVAELVTAALGALDLPADERDWLGPRLAALLGAGGATAFAREDLFSAWTAFLERVSRWAGRGTAHAPVVLLVDDAQYADDGLLRFVEHLCANGDFPCFVVLLTRPGLLEAQPSLATNRRSVVMHLETLDDDEMGRLLDGLVVGLGDADRDTLVRRAEGVPLFAVETVRSLIDRDLVVPRGGQYVLHADHAVDLDDLGAPASLHALVAARLDTLPADQRRVIDRASVAGQTFGRATLEALCAGPDGVDGHDGLDGLDGALAGLIRLQLLRQVSNRLSAEMGQYEFVQAVVRQVAYGMLSRRDRKAGHLLVADALTRAGEHPGDTAAMVAQHLLLAIEAVPDDGDVAELSARAVAWLRRAAERASTLGLPGAAAAHLADALDRAGDPVVRAEVELELAVALVSDADYAAATRHAVAAREAWDALGDPVRAGRAAAALGGALAEDAGEFEAAIAATAERYADLRGRGDAVGVRVELGRVLTIAHMRLGHDIAVLADEQVRLAAELGDPFAISDSYTALGLHYASQGVEDLSRTLFATASDLSRRNHDVRGLVRPLNNLASSLNPDDLERGAAAAREALEAGEVVGERFWIATSSVNLALACYERGEWATALEAVSHAEALSVIAELVRGRVHLARGEDFAPDPERIHGVSADPSLLIYEELTQALVRRASHDPAAVPAAMGAVRAALSQFGLYEDFWICWAVATEAVVDAVDLDTAAELGAMLGGVRGEALPTAVRAYAERMAGRLAATREAPSDTVDRHFRAALSAAASWGGRVLEARASAEYGVWLARVGRGDEAAPLLERARAAYQSFGADAWRAELDDDLAATGAGGAALRHRG